jgi:hypothetical protein
VTPLGDFGTPEGIAAAIAFVASDEASHMNGADILIDGATLSRGLSRSANPTGPANPAASTLARQPVSRASTGLR